MKIVVKDTEFIVRPTQEVRECDECKGETEFISEYEGDMICPHCLIDHLMSYVGF